MKEIRFSKHAFLRCLQRNINEETAKYALNEPDYVKRSFNKRKLLLKKIGDITINVVFIEEEKYINVITVY